MNAEIAERLVEVFSRPTPLMDGAELIGDPLETLPVLYHLLWNWRLVADLAVPLSHRTVVRAAHEIADLAEVADVAVELAEVAAGDHR
jgi:hypothetical protein